MLVKNLILFQIATDRNYKVGDIFEFGKVLNNQGMRTLHSELKDGNQLLSELGSKHLNSINIFKNKPILRKFCKSLDESDFIIRELAFENERLENFQTFKIEMYVFNR